MSNTQPAISIQPVISYPHQAQVGKTYLMTIDLESPENEWPYEEEEYPIYCMLETSPLFSYKTLGEPAIVLHRFGGSYGAAKFLLTAALEEMQGEITVTFVNGWGVPIRVLKFDEISITQSDIPAQPTGEIYKREVLVNQKSGRNTYVNERNPYVIGTPIETLDKLFGRDTILAKIQEYLQENQKFILLYGQRRIGKSSVLKNIPLFIAEDNIVYVSYDLQVHRYFNMGEILVAIINEILKLPQLDINGFGHISNPLNDILNKDLDLKEIPKITLRLISNVCFQLSQQQLKLVLLLDEFDVVNQQDTQQAVELLRFLNNLTLREDELYVIAVVPRTLNFTSELVQTFRNAQFLEIGLLDDDSATQLITQTAINTLQYKPKTITEILKLSSGHPYYTQVLCYEVFNLARQEQELNFYKFTIVPEDVITVLPQAIDSAEAGLGAFWDGSNIYEKVVVSTIAQAQEQIIKDPFQTLEDYGLVLTEPLKEAIPLLISKGFMDSNPIKIKVEIIRLWLLERHQLRDEIANLETIEERSVKPLLDIADHLWGQDNTKISALNQYEQILHLNPNHFRIIVELAEKYLQVDANSYDKALPLYERAYKLDRSVYKYKFIEVLDQYGDYLQEQGNYIKAKEQYEKIIQIDPDNTLVNQKLTNISLPKPPEPFVGRKSIIQIAFDQIYHRSHLALWGGLGTGKTSLLKKLASPDTWIQNELDPSLAVIVYFSCYELKPFTSSGFWTKVISLLKVRLDHELELQNLVNTLLIEGQISKDSLRQILEVLGQIGKFLVLLIDDYDVALAQNKAYSEEEIQQLLSECRSLVVHAEERRNLSVIVTSKKSLNNIRPTTNPNQSPWYNHYLFRQIKPFNKNEIKEFIELSFNRRIPQELQEAITEITGGNPVLVDTAISLISWQLQSSNSLNIQHFVKGFESNTRHFFETIWDGCSEVEQTFLMLIALDKLRGRLYERVRYDWISVNLIFSQNYQILTNLEEQGFIYRNTRTKKYFLISSFMELWIIQEIENTNEQRIMNPLLNLMSHRQAQQVIAAIEWLRNHRDEVYSQMRQMVNLEAGMQRFFEG